MLQILLGLCTGTDYSWLHAATILLWWGRWTDFCSLLNFDNSFFFLLECILWDKEWTGCVQLQSWLVELTALVFAAKSGWWWHKYKDSLSRISSWSPLDLWTKSSAVDKKVLCNSDTIIWLAIIVLKDFPKAAFSRSRMARSANQPRKFQLLILT